MVRAAAKSRLRVLGLSEHIFQMRDAREPLLHMPLEGPLTEIASYSQAVREAAQEEQFDVRLGLEVDFIPEELERILTPLRGHNWDFLIGSVHQVDGVQFEAKDNYTKEEGEQSWKRYFELLRAAVKSREFSLVSHPVRMRSTNPYIPEEIDNELEQLAAEATRQDVALEVNGFDMLTYPALVQRLVRAFALHNTPVCVGSDAHIPGQVARAHMQSEALLKESGIKKVRIWKQGVPEEYAI